MQYLVFVFVAALMASLRPVAAPSQPVVEFTRFQLQPGVAEADFLAAAAQMQADFLDRQPGYLRRSLVKSENGWIDVVYWTSEAAHQAAMQQAEQAPAVGPFMQMIDFSSVEMELATVHFSAQP